MSYLKKIIYLLDKDLKFVPFIFLCFLLTSLLELFSLSYVGAFLKYILQPDDENIFFSKLIYLFGLDGQISVSTVSLCYLLILIFFIKSVVSISVDFIVNYFSLRRQEILRVKLTENYQNLSYESFVSRNSSEYIRALEIFVAKYSRLLTAILLISRDLLISLSIIAVLFYTNYVFLIFLFSGIIIIMILYYFLLLKKVDKYGSAYNEAVRGLFQTIQESMRGYKEFKILGINYFFTNKVKWISRLITKNRIKMTIISSTPRHLLEFFFITSLALFILFYFGIDQSLTSLIPTLGVFVIASLRFIGILSQIVESISVIRFNFDTINKLYKDVKIETTENQNFNNFKVLDKNDVFKSIRLEKVFFKYPRSEVNILKNISINIEQGQIIGIFGQSGSGKTTLLDIILGLLHPTSGEMFYNNKNINNYFSIIKKKSAYLTQDSYLIDDNLVNNIAIGIKEKDIDMDKIRRSLIFSSLNFFPTDEKIINRSVGEDGSMLSGGQKQRVVLARAFYFDREIIVMDESTNSLDNETENKIFDEIKKLKKKITFIIVSHKLDIMKICDKVYHLKKGYIKLYQDYKDIQNK